MNEKETHRIEKLGSAQFQNIILVLVTALYDYGLHLLSDEFSQQEIMGVVNTIFEHGSPDYVFYDDRTFEFYRMLLDRIEINNIEPMEEFLDKEGMFLINDVYNFDGRVALILDDNYKLPMDLIKQLCELRRLSNESFIRLKEASYFASIIPGTKSEYYYPVEKTTTYDVANLINIVSLCNFLSFGITCLHFRSSKTRLLDKDRIILTKEELMSIQLFLQDAARKLSLTCMNHYDTEVRVLYAIPAIDYQDVDYESDMKKELMNHYKVKLAKNDFILSEDGLLVVLGRLTVLSYQN